MNAQMLANGAGGIVMMTVLALFALVVIGVSRLRQ
jgi:hypothetical protein